MARQTEVYYYHYDTPKRARVKGAIAYAQRIQNLHGIPINYQDIFQTCQVSKTRGYIILKEVNRTFHNACFKARRLTYSQLVAAAGIDKEVCSRTVRRALGTRDWRKCIACPRSFVSARYAKQREEFARKSLEIRPAKEDYRDILYSDEWHASCGDDRQISSNNNRKITALYYRNYVLKKFILEEDRDLSHYLKIITEYKKKEEIRFFYNAPGSPDLSPIKNA
ncbi:hypothetical protein V8C34DRAFT_312214 [Trichoderma compactum]